MMKKGFLISFLVIFVAGGAFAQSEFSLSTGGGVLFTNDFGGGYETSEYSMGNTGIFKTPYAGGGGFVFFDAIFMELSLSFSGGGGTSKEYNASGAGIDISLLGKYPNVINKQFTLIGLLGFTYRSIFSVNLDGKKTDVAGDLNAFWFKFGGGLDYSVTDKMFLRTEILYGLRTENKFEKNMVYKLEKEGKSRGVNAENLLGHGFEIKFAVGYKFPKFTKQAIKMKN